MPARLRHPLHQGRADGEKIARVKNENDTALYSFALTHSEPPSLPVQTFTVPSISLFGLECLEGREITTDTEIINMVEEGFNNHILSLRVNRGWQVLKQMKNSLIKTPLWSAVTEEQWWSSNKFYSDCVCLLLQLGDMWAWQLPGAPVPPGTNRNHQLAEVQLATDRRLDVPDQTGLLEMCFHEPFSQWKQYILAVTS